MGTQGHLESVQIKTKFGRAARMQVAEGSGPERSHPLLFLLTAGPEVTTSNFVT